MRRGALLLLGGAAVLAVGAVALREPLRRVAERTVAEGGLLQVRIGRATPDGIARVPGQPELEAAVFRPAGAPSAAVLLVHGNRPEGGDAPLYRLLARELARHGVWTAVLSLRGFGRSAPAPSGAPLTAGDLRDDVSRGLAWMEGAAPPGVPRGLAGHSLGGLLALDRCGTPGLRVVSLEPGKEIGARVVRPPAPDLDAFTRKLAENVRGAAVTPGSVRALYGSLDPEVPAGPVPPGTCTVVHGTAVGEAGRASLERIVAARPGAGLRWVETRDHFLGAGRLGLGNLDVWSSRSLAAVTRVIVSCVVSEQGERGDTGG